MAARSIVIAEVKATLGMTLTTSANLTLRYMKKPTRSPYRTAIAEASVGVNTPETIPPTMTIENPLQGEISLNRVVNISGTAFDKSGIKEVLVNGNYSGTDVWEQKVRVQEGINNITITTLDNSGNNHTESIQVVYRPAAQPAIVTPGKTVTSAPTSVIVKDAVNKPVSYNIILISMLFFITMALIYWIYNLKK